LESEKLKNVRAESFNEVALLYDHSRAGYPIDVYKTIQEYLPKDHVSEILEIGSGNGVASVEIIEYFNTKLTILEPGIGFIPLLFEKFKNKENITIINKKFEEYENPRGFDCIISATAFHWLSEKEKYQKTAMMLKDKGIIALFWNNYSRDDKKIFDEIQNIYDKHHPDVKPIKDIRNDQKEKLEKRKQEFVKEKNFRLCKYKIFQHKKYYNTDSYLNLLRSFSDNSTKPQDAMEKFYLEMKKLLNNNGGRIEIPIVVDLIIGEKAV